MIPAHRPRARRSLVCLALGWAATLANADQAVSTRGQQPGPGLPAGLEIEWQGRLEQTEDGGAEFIGPVTMVWRESRIQADRLSLRDRRYIEAEGNVLIVWGQNRVFGNRMHYDLEEERGVIEEAIGYALDQYLIWAEKIEKIGDKKLKLTQATVTTCTQPLPYWSFAVSSATVTLESYARMWNVRLRALKAPVLYVPYLVWPVKPDRAAGFLMPEFGSTAERGQVVTLPLFVPLGRSADMTLIGRYYTEAGFMSGSEFRFIPNLKGSGTLSGFVIDDDAAGEERYRFDYHQTQEFRNGFRMVADVGLVSDSDYYTDFERDLNLVSTPQSLARLEFSRNGPWASLNVSELRLEQLSTGLVQSTYPEIEWRGRSRKLGHSPFYLTFLSSLAAIQQQSSTLDADYLRADLRPEITLPYSPSAWFDITPRVAYRWTHWTQHQTTTGLVDDSLSRQLWSYGVELVGPKIFRVFGDARAGSRYKHTIEPHLSYGFDEEFDRFGDVLSYDEIDQARGAGTRATYALVQRLFAKRPQAEPTPPPAAADSIVLPDGTTMRGTPSPDAAPETPSERPSVPVEIASFELRQARSFDEDLSFADLDDDGVQEESSPYSDISATGRVNPSPGVSVDVRSIYDILYQQIQDVSLSGTLRNPLTSVKLSVVHRNGLGVSSTTLEPIEDSTQAQLAGELSLLQDKLHLKLAGSYDADPAPGDGHFPEQHWQVLYSTQCCTFLVEGLNRTFGSTDERRDIHFRIDLHGVGKLVEKTF